LGGDAQSGKPNLYVWHGTAAGSGTVSYIATLRAPTSEEAGEIEAMAVGAFEYHSDVADWTSRPTETQAYVTPDGRHLAFMSVEPLTGYDNEDQATGVADHEVFEYSAETGQLVCASCDPGDVRPLGSAFIGAKLGERVSTPFHQPRSLSDDGSRLFFSSPDPLVAGISGDSTRVFEYEDGSVQLISGTESGGGAVFLDASASGERRVLRHSRTARMPTDTDESGRRLRRASRRRSGGTAGADAVSGRRLPGTAHPAAVVLRGRFGLLRRRGEPRIRSSPRKRRASSFSRVPSPCARS
jgi:hypothetical protein